MDVNEELKYFSSHSEKKLTVGAMGPALLPQVSRTTCSITASSRTLPSGEELWQAGAGARPETCLRFEPGGSAGGPRGTGSSVDCGS